MADAPPRLACERASVLPDKTEMGRFTLLLQASSFLDLEHRVASRRLPHFDRVFAFSGFRWNFSGLAVCHAAQACACAALPSHRAF